MNPIVETTGGKLRGALTGGVAAFRGVPYGASTAGANRFMPPRPPQPWAGVRDALDYAGQAPQARLGPAPRAEMVDFSGPPDPSPETEDCLTLNVWTPAAEGTAKRPVMVWLHGGAFSFGSANSLRLQGMRLCQRGDVVLVTVNQRLNIFGHLDLSELGGAEYAASGNAGTLDMVAALQWVRDNIAGFGGDPGCVTIFGESGGGGKVSTLLAMASARGLFHRAIVQSGASVRLRTRDRAAKLTEAVMHELGLTRAALADLHAMPMRRLLAAIGPAQQAIGPSPWPLLDRYPFGPVVDGTLLPRQPFDPDATPVSADIPLVIGDCTHEAALFLAHDDKVWHRTLTDAELHARVAAVAGAQADRVVATYRRLMPGAGPAERLIATLTDCNFRIRSLLMAERRARQSGAPVWMYSFAWRTPLFDGRLGAPHAIDVPFTFDTLEFTNATDRSAAAHALAATMSGAWATFAHAGVPGHASLPAWPAYSEARRATMVLDADCHVADDPGAETRALWAEIAGA
ncbi:MAG TPA: carboxylesterase/lipase family protein [Acetobacteraceae bacterium]|nr:carboxylesterase/lipase family protein [Acetobacteraceae bacterium]